ncbi:MAG TPA: response regulator [Anaeromyxobacter sp.]
MMQRVLVLDHNSAARKALTAALKRLGFDVLGAGDLDELDAALARGRSDVLLLELQLPDVYGNDLVPWLRETRHVDRPILLYANRAADELHRLAEECGADGFVRKTGRPDEAAAHVERFLTGGDA